LITGQTGGKAAVKAIAYTITLLTIGILTPTAEAFTLQQTVHDVAVTNIQGPSGPVAQGDVLNINVSVQNLGDGPETFSVSLHDDTDNKPVNTIPMTLDPGQAALIGFQWDTSNASSGSHLLTATASAANDQNPSNNSITISPPITVTAVAPASIILGDGTGLELPDASFGFGLLQPGVNTPAVPQSSIFIGNADASFTGALVRVAVGIPATPLQNIFVANADATFQPSAPLQNPFGQQNPIGQGEVQGTVHLEGLSSSLGGFVKVGEDIHFLDSDGSFRFMASSGTVDIIIQAPGHIPILIPNTQINPGDTLSIPELTLPFGDGNGDGKVDILDLSRAADNFGETTEEMTLP
jgi:hypothetical protein